MPQETKMKEVVIDIGCGENKVRGSIGLDVRPCSGVDIVCRFDHALPLKNESVDTIWCRHVLEHMADLEPVLKELRRVLKDSGRIHIIVPHFSNSLAYSDYTHRRFFGLYTFDYFSSSKSKYWWVPSYVSSDQHFIIERKRLVFRNIPLFGRIIEVIVNYSEFTSYLYEGKLSWMLPCFEIIFILQKEERVSGVAMSSPVLRFP